jgi:hypothetical protein
MTDKTIVEARERFKAAEEAWSELRADALDDIKFARLGEQWPEDILRQRQRDGRPALTINRLPAFIRQVVNDARQSKPAIKVRPVDDTSDPDTAEVLAGLIRHVEYASDAQVAYDTALECAVTSGFGFFRVDVEYAHDDAWDLDLRIRRIANPLSVYWDPGSMAADSSDWEYCFVTEMLAVDEFKRRFPGADVSDWDADKDQTWITEDMVRVAEYWRREQVKKTLLRLSDGTTLYADRYEENKDLFDVAGLTVTGEREVRANQVRQVLMSGAEVLDRTEWKGRYIPIIPVYGDEVVVEGQRHFLSLIRPAIDAQRMYNFWRTASTELVALAPKAPWIGPRGAFVTDQDKWATANTESHAYIEFDGPTPPQRIPFDGVPAGALQEALNASDDLKSIMGMYDASLGARSNETSGKAILARQREGDISTFHYTDNLARALRHAGRVLVDLIPSVYAGPRVLRILGVDNSVQTVQANQPFEQGGMMRMHDLTTGRYDVTVDVGPSYTTRRQEAAEQMVQMIQAYPDLAPIVGDILAKNLDWPEADEIAKRLKVMLPPQLQQLDELEGVPPQAQAALAAAQQQMQQMQQVIEQGQQVLQQMQQQVQKLELEKAAREGDTAARLQEAELKYRAEVEKAAAEVEKARIEAGSAADLATIEATVEMLTERMQIALEEMKATVAAQVKAPAPATEAPEKEDRPRTVTIQAPSGGVYTGTIN